MGLCDAILWLDQLGLWNVQIELDHKLVIDRIIDRFRNQSKFGIIMSRCRLLLCYFSNLKINFVGRQKNCVVHSVNKDVKVIWSSLNIWFNFILYFFWWNNVSFCWLKNVTINKCIFNFILYFFSLKLTFVKKNLHVKLFYTHNAYIRSLLHWYNIR